MQDQSGGDTMASMARYHASNAPNPESLHATNVNGYNSGSYSAFPVDGIEALSSAYTSDFAQHGGPPAGQNVVGGRGGRGGRSGEGQGGPHQKRLTAEQQQTPSQTKESKSPAPFFYCDVCRVSCAGPQPFAAHLAGQKHKKKEAQSKLHGAGPGAGTAQSGGANPALVCELCSVMCGSADTYNAHLRGSRHLRTVNLHNSLGKPIPPAEPIAIQPSDVSTAKSAGSADSADNIPAIVGESYIEAVLNDRGAVVSFSCKLCECSFTDPGAKLAHLRGRRHRLVYKKKVDPTIHVEMKLSDKAAKTLDARLRQQAFAEENYRRHHNAISMLRHEFRHEAQMTQIWRAEQQRAFGFQRMYLPLPPPLPPRFNTLDDRYVINKHAEITLPLAHVKVVQTMIGEVERALKLTSDAIMEEDRAAMAGAAGKPATTGAKEKSGDGKFGTEAKKVTAASESVDGASGGLKAKVGESGEGVSEAGGQEIGDNKDWGECGGVRALTGVMRAGLLSAGLLLAEDRTLDMVVLCADPPTATLFHRIADHLTESLTSESKDMSYDIESCVEEARLVVTCQSEPTFSCNISVTSAAILEQHQHADPSATYRGGGSEVEKGALEGVKEEEGLLPRQPCLAGLARLRRSHWFQMRVAGLRWGELVIKVLRDLCRRIPTWSVMSDWALELLTEKCICYAGLDVGPAEIIRSVFECIASGILLQPVGHGLLDPCERDATDVFESLSAQEREDITSSAQMALRMIVFRQIYRVLDMAQLPPRPPPHTDTPTDSNPNKRRIMGADDVTVVGAEEKKPKEESVAGSQAGRDAGADSQAAARTPANPI